MAKKKEIKQVKEVEVRKISKELCEILDKLKEIVSDFGWGELKVSDTEVSRILARKIRENNLLEK